MENNHLEIVDKSTVSSLVKELKYIDDSILEKTSYLLPQLKATVKSLSEVVPRMHSAVNYISMVKYQDEAVQKQIKGLDEKTVTIFKRLDEVTHSNKMILIENEAILEKSESLIERLEEIDFEIIKNVIRKDIKVLERELKTSILRDFKRQQTKLKHTYALFVGVFIIGSITTAILIHFLKG